MQKIIFVCLGNICRSPLAEGCAKAYLEQHPCDIEISSAGTGSWHIGEAPCENSIRVAHNHGIDISMLRASQFTKQDAYKYDMVVALDQSNFENLKALGAKNIVKLGSFGYEGADVPDPYFFSGFEGFEKVFAMVQECTINLMKEQHQSHHHS